MAAYPTDFRSLLATPPTKRRVFISYHHGGDQAYYDQLSSVLHDQLDLIYDNSLERKIDSDDVNYVFQRIRDNFITNTSCTIVLCGAKTAERKYVDWEIKATLDKQHGLIGLCLPTAVRESTGMVVPARYGDNYHSGYAPWYTWADLVANPGNIVPWIEDANKRDKKRINNSREMKGRNG